MFVRKAAALTSTILFILCAVTGAGLLAQDRPSLLQTVENILAEVRGTLDELENASLRKLASHILVSLTAQAGKVQEALEIARQEFDSDLSEPLVGEVVETQAYKGDLGGAFLTAESIQNPTVKAQAVGRMAQVLAERGDLLGAMQIAHSIPDSEVHVKAFTLKNIASIQYRDGDHAGVGATLELARRFAAQVPLPRFRARLLGEIAALLALVGDRFGAEVSYHEALEALDEIQSERNKAFVISPVVEALVYLGDVATARELADGMEAEENRLGLYERIARAHIRGGNLQLALTLAADLPDSDSRERLYGEIAMVYLWQRKTTEVLQLAGRMQEGPWKARLLTGMALRLGGLEFLQQARRIVEAMEAGTEKDSVVPHVARVLIRFGDVTAAHQLVESLGDSPQKETVIQHVANAQASAGDWQRALDWARRQESVSARVHALLGTVNGILNWLQVQKRRARTRR